MTKHGKVLPARRSREAFEESLLIRSAESVGRVIGSLQRQLDSASRRIAGREEDVEESVPVGNNGNGGTRNSAARKNARKNSAHVRAAGAGRGKSGNKKTQSTADRTSKRAPKSSRAKKTAASGGSRRKSAARVRR